MNSETKQLIKLKEEIDFLKTKRNKLEGQIEAVRLKLKELFETDSLSEIKIQIKEKESNLKILEQKLEKGIKDLEEDLKGRDQNDF